MAGANVLNDGAQGGNQVRLQGQHGGELHRGGRAGRGGRGVVQLALRLEALEQHALDGVEELGAVRLEVELLAWQHAGASAQDHPDHGAYTKHTQLPASSVRIHHFGQV